MTDATTDDQRLAEPDNATKRQRSDLRKRAKGGEGTPGASSSAFPGIRSVSLLRKKHERAVIFMAAKLAVVTDETRPPLPDPTTIKDAVERSERTLLVTMRATVAATIDSAPPAHTLAPLMRQLREIDKEIRAIDARAKSEGEDGAAEVEDGTFDASAV